MEEQLVGKKQGLDNAKSEAFAGLTPGVLNKSALSYMISPGHRAGLFYCMDNTTGFTLFVVV
jgi:hypothetical protein